MPGTAAVNARPLFLSGVSGGGPTRKLPAVTGRNTSGRAPPTDVVGHTLSSRTYRGVIAEPVTRIVRIIGVGVLGQAASTEHNAGHPSLRRISAQWYHSRSKARCQMPKPAVAPTSIFRESLPRSSSASSTWFFDHSGRPAGSSFRCCCGCPCSASSGFSSCSPSRRPASR